MPDKINFELPKREQKKTNLLPVIFILLVVLIIIGGINIALLAVPSVTGGSTVHAGGLTAAEQKDLALKLQMML